MRWGPDTGYIALRWRCVCCVLRFSGSVLGALGSLMLFMLGSLATWHQGWSHLRRTTGAVSSGLAVGAGSGWVVCVVHTVLSLQLPMLMSSN